MVGDRVVELRALLLARRYREVRVYRSPRSRTSRPPATIKASASTTLLGGKVRWVRPATRVCRGCGADTQRQGRRLRVLQGVPPRRDRAAPDARACARRRVILAHPLRTTAALVLRLGRTRTFGSGTLRRSSARAKATGPRQSRSASSTGAERRLATPPHYAVVMPRNTSGTRTPVRAAICAHSRKWTSNKVPANAWIQPPAHFTRNEGVPGSSPGVGFEKPLVIG